MLSALTTVYSALEGFQHDLAPIVFHFAQLPLVFHSLVSSINSIALSNSKSEDNFDKFCKTLNFDLASLLMLISSLKLFNLLRLMFDVP